ncbi:MAG: hypothetical protein GY847_27610 [Proteobacteria bacterium]|nr:hypothetical protein [Pseudomonadota bacterium]
MKTLQRTFVLVFFITMGLLYVSSRAVLSQNHVHENKWMFDKDKVETVPKGWRVGETSGRGKPGKWEVVKDASAPTLPNVIALTQTRNSGRTFNLLIAEKTGFKDVKIEVKVKAMAGKEDQGGGPIWRARDKNNYYVARWNPLENNFRVYHVKNSKRTQIASAYVRLNANDWHEIKIRHVGTMITAELDDKKLIELEDNTFQKAGMIGLWTKADAATAFDDIEVEEIKAGKQKHKRADKEDRDGKNK